MNADTGSQADEYALMGHPVTQSVSPRIHQQFAQQTGQAIRYHRIDVQPDGFEDAVRRFVEDGGRGLNVTVPHKRAAHDLADKVSMNARIAAAANTLSVDADGTLVADNTDGTGLVRDLMGNLGFAPQDKRILLVGAGGAARGALGALLGESPRQVMVANRNESRALELAQGMAGLGEVAACPLEGIDGDGFDLVINATSAGLAGELPAIPGGAVSGAVCYDMAYGAASRAFARWARERGAADVHDGVGMLVEQAAESFFLWRGVRPETAPVIADLRAD